MSEARAITNLIGNGVATLVVARWEGALDMERLRTVLGAGTAEQAALIETDEAVAHPEPGPAEPEPQGFLSGVQRAPATEPVSVVLHVS
jgi:hypothetical protein